MTKKKKVQQFKVGRNSDLSELEKSDRVWKILNAMIAKPLSGRRDSE